MANKKGDIARELANAPLAHTAADELANALKLAAENAAALNSGGDAEQQPSTAAEWLPGNPLARAFGRPVFVAGDRKLWPDKTDKNVKSGTMAKFLILSGPCFEISASIYRKETIVEENGKRYMDPTLTASMPKALSIKATPEEDHEYRAAVLAEYDAWEAVHGGSAVAVASRSSQPRLVRTRVAL